MTNEPEVMPTLDAGYMQFALPGHPYSVMRFSWGADIEWYVAESVKLRNALDEAFAPEDDTAVDTRPAQQQRQQPQQRRAPSQGQSAGTGVYCPDHNIECYKTKPEYDKDGDRYYHPLSEDEQYYLNDGRLAKNHSLYLRQTVTVDGESNVQAANAMRNGSGGELREFRGDELQSGDVPALTDADAR